MKAVCDYFDFILGNHKIGVGGLGLEEVLDNFLIRLENARISGFVEFSFVLESWRGGLLVLKGKAFGSCLLLLDSGTILFLLPIGLKRGHLVDSSHFEAGF